MVWAIWFLCSVSFLACLSAAYNESLIYACRALIAVSWRFLPSAWSRICSGIVYPLAFFQFEIHAGIYQSFMSWGVSFLGGDRIITGASSIPAPPAIFLCLCLGGSRGSSTTFEIYIIRWTPELELEVGVYRRKLSLSTFFKCAEQRNAGSLFLETATPRRSRVASRFAYLCFSDGLVRSAF